MTFDSLTSKHQHSHNVSAPNAPNAHIENENLINGLNPFIDTGGR